MKLPEPVQQVIRQYEQQFGTPNISDPHSRQWTYGLAEQLRYTFGPVNNYGTKSAHQDPNGPQSTDAQSRIIEGRLWSWDIVASGGSPAAVVNPNADGEDITGQRFIDVSPGHDHLGIGTIGDTPASTRLMKTWFCFQRALRDWPDRAIADADYLRNQTSGGLTLLRVMGHVTGGPWVEAAVDLFDPRWGSDFQRMCDRAEERSWQFLFTYFGGHHQVPTLDDKKRAVDAMSQAIRTRRHLFRAGELVNELFVNGWERSDVRELVRHAHPQVDGLPLAASSPHLAHNVVHTADASRVSRIAGDGVTTDVPSLHIAGLTAANLVEQYNWRDPTEQELLDDTVGLYGGLPCQILTWHRTRDRNSPWNDIRNCKRFADHLGLELWDSEPEGFRASAGGDITDFPEIFSQNYRRAIEAHCGAEDLHSRWGVFNGELDTNQWPQYVEKSVRDHRNMDVVLINLGEIARTGSGGGAGGGSGGGEPGGGGGEMPAQPYPDEPTWWAHYEAQIVASYQEAYDKGLRASPQLDSAAFRWFSRPGYTIGTGVEANAAAERHLAECRAALGL
jgi:hypothetical protein